MLEYHDASFSNVNTCVISPENLKCSEFVFEAINFSGKQWVPLDERGFFRGVDGRMSTPFLDNLLGCSEPTRMVRIKRKKHGICIDLSPSYPQNVKPAEQHLFVSAVWGSWERTTIHMRFSPGAGLVKQDI
jgi:hypothetical protein